MDYENYANVEPPSYEVKIASVKAIALPTDASKYSDDSQPPPYSSLYPTQHVGRGSSHDVTALVSQYDAEAPTISERPDTSANVISFDQDEVLSSEENTGKQHHSSVQPNGPPSAHRYFEFGVEDHASTDSDQLAETFERLSFGDRSAHTSNSFYVFEQYEYCPYTTWPYEQDDLPAFAESSLRYGARAASERAETGASLKDTYTSMPIPHDRRNERRRRYKLDNSFVPPGLRPEQKDLKGRQCSGNEDQLAESMGRVGLNDRYAYSVDPSEPDNRRAYCIHPSCLNANGRKTTSYFRKADLARHVRSAHERQYIDCPKRNCVRKGDQGFTRNDHLMEHRRQFHMEKLPKKVARVRNTRHGRHGT